MTNNSVDRSYEDEYAGMGTFVDPEAVLYERSPYVEWPTENVADFDELKKKHAAELKKRRCANDEHLAPDPDASLAFLRVLRPAGPWVLTAIVPDGPTATDTFDEAGVRKFIATRNARENIYFTGNPCGRVSKKPTKADMTGAIFLHTDDDPRDGETPDAAKKRILAGYDAHNPPPSVVIDSGNGLQGIWLLDAEYQFSKIEDISEIELRNKALALSLGTTPGTHNVDRLLRLPGTVNHPNEAKRKKGRVDCPATIVRITDARHPLGSFSKAEEKAKAEEKEKPGGADELSQSLRALLYIPDTGAGNPAGGYEDRSALMFAFVTMALRKVNRDVIVRICLDPAHQGHAIYEHCTEKGGAEYLERQIDRAREEIKKASPSLIIGIARRLWGEATSQQGEEHRFGTRTVNARSGWWYDFDACEGGSLRELMRKAAARARAADAPTPTLRWHGDADPLKAIKWLIQDLLPETAFGSLSGQWGTYKTFVALDIAACVMTEQPFLRFQTRRKGGVLFIAAEGAYTIGVRLQAVVEAKCSDAKRLPFTWLDASPLLLDSGAVDALVKIAAEVDAKMRAEHGVPLVLIIIDTIAVAAGYEERGDENDMTIGTRITATMSNLAKRTNTFVLGVDHFGKSVETGTRGSSAKETNPDIILALLGERSVTGKTNNTRLALRKRRTGENGEEFNFRPRVVDLGVDENGGTITSVVIDWLPDGARQSVGDPWAKTRALKALRKALTDAVNGHGFDFLPSAGSLPVRAVSLRDLRGAFKAAYPSTEEEPTKRASSVRKAFQRVFQEAHQADLIVTRETEDEPIIWEVEKPL